MQQKGQTLQARPQEAPDSVLIEQILAGDQHAFEAMESATGRSTKTSHLRSQEWMKANDRCRVDVGGETSR